MTLDRLSKQLITSGVVFYTILTLLCLNVPFFWDTILTSSIAQWFFDHDLQNGIPPIEWDAGHPTFFQIYIFGLWKIFGKSLAISHLAMLPFLYTIVLSFVYLLQKVTTEKFPRIVGSLIFALHPYILTQSTLISYDIVQLAFFLIFLIGFTNKRKSLLLIGTIGLSSCSVRGQIFALVAWMVFLIYERKEWKQYIFFAFISTLPIIFWNLYHYLQTGWMLTTPSTTWESQRSIAQLHQVLSNVLGVVRSFMDYGTISLSVLFLMALFYFQKNKKFHSAKVILYTTLSFLVVLVLVLISLSNAVAHRYFMIIHAGMILFVVSQWSYFPIQKILSFAVVIILASGHFWLYPKEYSNGWDVTLKYLSYEKNRKSFHQYLSEEHISENSISTAFPLFCSNQQTNLIPGNRLIDISLPEANQLEYIAVSAVCNDMRGIHTKNLRRVKTFGKGKTAITLYLKEASN